MKIAILFLCQFIIKTNILGCTFSCVALCLPLSDDELLNFPILTVFAANGSCTCILHVYPPPTIIEEWRRQQEEAWRRRRQKSSHSVKQSFKEQFLSNLT